MKFNELVMYLTFLFIGLQSTYIFSQDFKRIEFQSGLSSLRDNTGVAVADYDGDNDLDLFVVSKAKDIDGIDVKSQLFRNNNDGTFTDVTEEAGLTNLHPYEDSHQNDPFNYVNYAYQEYKWGVSWGDYDNDGNPDLFFTNAYRLLLYRNLGNGTFENVTEAAGIDHFNGCFNSSAIWFDYNNDRFLDIYIGDYGSSCGKNSFYVNNGNGTFTNASDIFTSDESVIKFNFMSIPIDVNNDGWLDIYLANDFGENDLYINQNGTSFVEQSESYNLDDSGNGMGLSVGDYDNDGLFDIYLSNIDNNILFKNTGNNSYVNTAIQTGVSSVGWAWDSRFTDFDLDGDEDLLVLNGYNNHIYHNAYFKNLLKEGQNTFSNSSVEENINEFSFSLSSEVFDYDNDGDLEVFITNKDDYAFFYDNKTIDVNQPDNIHWLKVKLEGTISNRDAIGAKVSIKTTTTTYNRYYHGASLYSQSIQPVHFGIGDESEILELKIIWPSGLVETYDNIDVDQTLLVAETQGFEVLDIESSERVRGCLDPNSCNYDPLAVVDDGSCTYLNSGEISGNTNSSYLQTEVYSYPLSQPDAKVNWEVEGGQIIETLGDNSIKIKWGFHESGKVIATEYSGCSSLPSELQVSLEAPTSSLSNESVARLWNEVLLEAIRGDFARPTVHARNLFHASITMYDAWAIYSKEAIPYFVNDDLGDYIENFDFNPNKDLEEARKETISYAVYRLLNYRFEISPGVNESQERFNLLMEALGYDINNSSIDYSNGDPAALGNYIAELILTYGQTDGSRESSGFDNEYYYPVNLPLIPAQAGNNIMTNPNRWQPLTLESFIDQSGNLISGNTPEFLSPEWGNVTPFSLESDSRSILQRDGYNYTVFHNPDNPPYLDVLNNTASSDAYKWGFSLVSIWGSHLDPNDNVMWDISPGTIGNIDISKFPKNYQDYPDFYNQAEGGDIGKGHAINPVTNNPYETQLVPRGDYTRVLAEFWADGPDSETPPGHWFTILNYVNDHPMFEKRLGGEGEMLDDLEWDAKAYFILGGAMHDAAITAWSIKGWHDYVRPVSAIRYMAEKGQSTDSSLDNYHIAGIPLIDGYIETVEESDLLAGRVGEHIGKIKLYTWRGHDYIGNTDFDEAGVGWVLAENWWPYQRPTFVTPPFAGFVSGHSTYSRAAAEVMTLLTGDAYFPGGYGEFIAKKNEFLVFEEGPSVDVKLQWATYRDASDQCSLSRIWGGIHPPADDIPGRLIGEKIGTTAYDYAIEYFNGNQIKPNLEELNIVYPNPIFSKTVQVSNTINSDSFTLYSILGKKIEIIDKNYSSLTNITTLKFPNNISSGVYILKINKKINKKLIFNNRTF